MRKYFRMLCLFMLCNVTQQGVQAQQRPQYSLYMQNNYILNPALSGIEEYVDVKLGSRLQWVGLKGAPSTYYLSGQGALGQIKAKGHHGVGGSLVYDKIGVRSTLSMNASYAYHLQLSDVFRISFGLGMGLSQYRLNTELLSPEQQGDPTLLLASSSQFLPDLSAGFWLYSPSFYLGFSAQQLIPATLNAGSATQNPDNRLVAHHFITTGYRFYLSSDISVTPSVMAKYVTGVPLSWEMTAKMAFQDRLWAGFSYREGSAFVVMAGVYMNELLNVSYAYDHLASSLGAFSAGSHEIVLGFMLGNQNRVRCPQNVW